MHTFSCSCGHVIAIDSPSDHAGYLVWDSDVDAAIAARRAKIDAFLKALATGQRDAWMRSFYGATSQSRFVVKNDVDIVEDILSKHDDYTRICYRCGLCGNMYIQVRSRNDTFRGYRLDEDLNGSV